MSNSPTLDDYNLMMQDIGPAPKQTMPKPALKPNHKGEPMPQTTLPAPPTPPSEASTLKRKMQAEIAQQLAAIQRLQAIRDAQSNRVQIVEGIIRAMDFFESNSDEDSRETMAQVGNMRILVERLREAAERFSNIS